MTRKGLRRGLLVALIILLAIAGGVILAGRSYLRSSHAAAQLASHLEAAAGAPVQVAGVDIGLTGESELHGLRFYEPGKTTGEPWAVIDQVQADVSALDVLRGAARPKELVLSGATLLLRFDREGKLLTHLPRSQGGQAVPTIRIERGKVTLRQEGRPDMVVSGINAQLAPDGDQLVLTGALADPHWGMWDLQATVHRGSGATSATLNTEHVHVTQSMLQSIALIDPDVWKHVQAVDGDTPVTFTLNVGAGPEPAHYRVTLAPTALRIFIPDVDLKLEQARGKILIADGNIRLRDVWARTAGGELEGNAGLDLHGTPERFHFVVKVRGLDLARLPPQWELPRQITGQLSGHADLRLVNEKEGLRSSGQGEGIITDARIANQPAEPILLKLHGDGKRFRFTSQSSARGAAPTAVAALTLLTAQPSPPKTGADTFLPTQAVDWLAQGMDQVQRGTRAAARWLASTLQQKPAKPRKDPNYLEVNLSLRNADLLQLLKGLGVAVPFSIAGTELASPVYAASMMGMTGAPLQQWPFLAAASLPANGPRITVRVQAGIPIDTPRDLKAYRLRGTVQLPRVVLEGLPLEQVSAAIDYSQGILRLEELKGQVPVPGQPNGTFRGSARLEVVPQGNLTAQLSLDQILLQQVLSVVPGSGGRAEGRFSGTFIAAVPADRLRDTAAWNIQGRLHSEQLQAYGLTLRDLAASARLRDGELTLAGVRANLESSPIAGRARLTLSGDFPFKGSLELPKLDLATLQRLSPDLRPPVPISGSATATGQFSGTLNPLLLTTKGSGSFQGVKLQNFQLGDLSLQWDSNPDRLQLTDIRARLYRGAVSGLVVLPLRAKALGRIDLQLKDLDLGAMVRDVPGFPVRLQGQAGGTVKGTFAPVKPGQQRAFTTEIDLSAGNLRVQDIPATNAHARLHYDRKTLRYDLDAEVLGGTLHLDGQFPPRTPAPPQPAPQSKRLQGNVLIWEGEAPAEPAVMARQEPRPPELGHHRLLPDGDLRTGSGQLRLRGVQLAQLWQALGIQVAPEPTAPATLCPRFPQCGSPGRNTAQPLRGRVDLQLDYRLEGPGRSPTGHGFLVITGLRWSDTEPPVSLRTEIEVAQWELRVQRASMPFLGGTFDGRLAWNFHTRQARGHVQLRGAQLAQLWQALGIQDTLVPLRGRFDIQLDLHYARPDHAANDYRSAHLGGPCRHPACESAREQALPTQFGTGLLIIDDLRWTTADTSPGRLQAEVQLGSDELRIIHIASSFPGGTMGGRVTWNFRDPNRRRFNFLVRDMPAERLSIFWPVLDTYIRGNLTATIRGRLGATWDGIADLRLARGLVLGVEVTEWDFPITFEFSPARGDVRLTVAQTTAQLGLGRATGHASWDLGAGSRLEGQILFYQVDLRTLLRPVEPQSQPVSGRANGRIDFAGSHVRSLNDVTANVLANFQDAQAMQLPVLQQIAPYLGLGFGSSATFQSGDLRGRLAGGVFRIQRLTLVGTTVQLMIEGAVTLEGRLNLDVYANVGNGGLGSHAALMALQLPLAGAIPLATLTRVSNFLVGRLIHLHVTGTVRHPAIQVQVLAMVSEEVARFFLLAAAGVPLP